MHEISLPSDNSAMGANRGHQPTSTEAQRENRLEGRNFIVKEIFNIATEMNLHSPGWEPFSSLILKKTGKRLPPGSLKYWYNGHSTPKFDEVDLMAKSLGYELELMKCE